MSVMVNTYHPNLYSPFCHHHHHLYIYIQVHSWLGILALIIFFVVLKRTHSDFRPQQQPTQPNHLIQNMTNQHLPAKTPEHNSSSSPEIQAGRATQGSQESNDVQTDSNHRRLGVWWRFMGYIDFGLILLTMMCGMLETSYLVDFYGTNHFTAQKLLPNFLLMLLFLLGLIVSHQVYYATYKSNDNNGSKISATPSTNLLTSAPADTRNTNIHNISSKDTSTSSSPSSSLLPPSEVNTTTCCSDPNLLFYVTNVLIVVYMALFFHWVTLPDMDGFGPFEISDGHWTPNEPSGAETTLSHSWHFLGHNLRVFRFN